jgi:hypothetical protein
LVTTSQENSTLDGGFQFRIDKIEKRTERGRLERKAILRMQMLLLTLLSIGIAVVVGILFSVFGSIDIK